MKFAFPFLAFLVLSPIAAAETRDYEAGPLTVSTTWNDVPDCVAPPTDLPCPLGYDANDTLDPRDDTVYQYRSLGRATVTFQLPGPVPSQSVEVDLANTRIPHPLVAIGVDTLVALQRALPPGVREHTAAGDHGDSASIVLRGPGLDGTEPTEVYYPLVVFFVPNSDRNGTTLVNGVAPYIVDTDPWVPSQLQALELCDIPQLGDGSAATCDVLPSKALEEAWPTLTPRVLVGATVNQTLIDVAATPLPLRRGGLPEDDARALLGTLSPAAKPAVDDQQVRLETLSTWSRPSVASPSSAPTPEVVLRHQSEDRVDAASVGDARLPYLLAAGLVAWPLARLFHRITRTRALDHARRSKLLEVAQTYPGIVIADAARALGVAYHSAHHHAHVLARGGHLDVVRSGRRLALYPASGIPPRQRAPLVALRRGPQAEALRIVTANPGLRLYKLAPLMGSAKTSAHEKLKRLVHWELVRMDAWGRYVTTPKGHEALALLEAPATSEPSSKATGQPLPQDVLAPAPGPPSTRQLGDEHGVVARSQGS